MEEKKPAGNTEDSNEIASNEAESGNSAHSENEGPTAARISSIFKDHPSQWKTRLKERLPKLGKSFQGDFSKALNGKSFNKESIQRAIHDFDPQALQEWMTQAFRKRNTAIYGTLVTIILSTFFLADLTSLVLEGFIPEPPVAPSYRRTLDRRKTIAEYSQIISRNLFSSAGLIPGVQSGADTGSSPDLNSPPVKSTLPFNLIGTVILEDPRRSIATIEDKSASKVYPVQIDDEIPDKVRILQIEPRRVIFLNLSSSRREYIELPEDPHSNPRVNFMGQMKPLPGTAVEQVSSTQYNVSRSEVDRALADFNNILTQARAVPNFENGVPAGYKLFQIVPGSIYDKLGLKNGYVITGLNGESINDPAKAFEMLNELKRSNHLELQIKIDGKAQTNTYDIR